MNALGLPKHPKHTTHLGYYAHSFHPLLNPSLYLLSLFHSYKHTHILSLSLSLERGNAERYCIMPVYRQGVRTFTEIYFSMHCRTILCGNIYEYRYNSKYLGQVEAAGGTTIGKSRMGMKGKYGGYRETGSSRTRTNFDFALAPHSYYICLDIARRRNVATYAIYWWEQTEWE